jgi:hypothetical protein
MITPLLWSWPGGELGLHGRSACATLPLPGGTSTVPGQGGRMFLWATGLALGVGFGAGGVGFGGWTVGWAVGGGAVGWVVGGLDGGPVGGGLVGCVCGVGRVTETGPTAIVPGFELGTMLGETVGVGDGSAGAVDDGSGLPAVGPGVGAAGVREGTTATGAGGGLCSATRGCRGIPSASAIAIEPMTRLRTPMATTSRARCAVVTRLRPSIRQAGTLTPEPRPANADGSRAPVRRPTPTSPPQPNRTSSSGS